MTVHPYWNVQANSSFNSVGIYSPTLSHPSPNPRFAHMQRCGSGTECAETALKLFELLCRFTNPKLEYPHIHERD